MEKKIVRFPDIGAIENEAATWVARLNGGDVSAAERQAFNEWQGRGTHHRETVTRLGVIWAELEALKEVSGPWEKYSAPMDSSDRLGNRIATKMRTRPMAVLAAIAAVLIVSVIVKCWITDPAVEFQSFQTQVGSQRTVSLSDGSRILLNTGSRVDVRWSRRERDVYLREGEAYFEVAADRNRPFLVFAAGTTVRAVGTAFAVRLADRKNVEVTVTKGEVELATQPTAELDPVRHVPLAARPAHRLGMLAAGQSAVFGDKIEQLAMVSDAKLDRKLAWRQGFIVFSGESLAQVVSEIGRYTTLKFQIDDPQLRSMQIDGYFEVGKVDALLEALERNFRVHVVRVNGSLVRLTFSS